jgi:tRNA 5-methylaminomethyl-2-thiouridine biosynthesis bifunctional protein
MKISPAEIEFRDGGIPFSNAFGDIYFSPEGGLAETQHVFIEGNSLRERWGASNFRDSDFVVGETGFGTGLNFLVALSEWRTSGAPLRGNRFTFLTCELHPLKKADLEKAHAFFPELKEFSDKLSQRYPTLAPGLHWVHFPEWNADLGLFLGDSGEFFEQVQGSVDAWFLDGFAPSKNPEMWGERLALGLARLSHAETTLATFSVSAVVKNPLRTAGFVLEKRKGFGRKREMLTGRFHADSPLEEKGAGHPWFSLDSVKTSRGGSVCVVGGGLAGCVLAGKLADRGFEVTLLERNEGLCLAGSGNPAGIFMPYFTAGENAASDLGLTAFDYFSRHWDLWWTHAPLREGERCGVWSVVDAEEAERVHRGLDRLGLQWDSEFAAQISAPEFETQTGLRLAQEASAKEVFFLGRGGWTRAGALGAAQIHGRTQVKVRTRVRVTQVIPASLSGKPVTVRTVSGESLEFDAVVMACAHTAAEALGWNPGFELQPLRGQVTEWSPEGLERWKLRQPVSFEGYLAPFDASGKSRWSLGSTFDLRDFSTDLDPKKNQSLMDQLVSQFDLSVLSETEASGSFDARSGRVAFRCTSSDRTPVVGPALDWVKPDVGLGDAPPIASGVHVFLGFGSRGINWIPYAAEVLSSAMAGGPPRLLKSEVPVLHSSRFAVRKLRKIQR